MLCLFFITVSNSEWYIAAVFFSNKNRPAIERSSTNICNLDYTKMSNMCIPIFAFFDDFATESKNKFLPHNLVFMTLSDSQMWDMISPKFKQASQTLAFLSGPCLG